jgi:hypothetical protein
MAHPRLTLFVLFWLFTAGVSAFDSFLLMQFASVLVEQNPVAVLLIHIGGVPLVIAVKMFGTTLALAGMILVYQRFRPAISMSALGGVALCQLTLLLYLVFA